MLCPKCGKDNKPDALFCAACGQDLNFGAGETTVLSQEDAPVSAPVYPVEPVAPVYEQPVYPAAAPYTPAAEPVAYEPTPYVPESAKKKGNAKKFLKFIPLVVVVAIIAVIAAIAVPTVAKLNSPLAKIGMGVRDLVASGDTYNATVKVEYDGEEQFEGKGSLDIDIDDKKAAFTGEATMGEESGDIIAGISVSDKQFVVDGNLKESYEGEEYSYDVYAINGVYAEFYDGEFDYGYEMDDDEVDMIFTSADYIFQLLAIVESPIGQSEEDMYNLLANAMSDIADEDIDDYIDYEEYQTVSKELDKIIGKDLEKCLTSEKWLEENAGLTVEKGDNGGKKYVFKTNPYDLMKGIMEDVIEPNIDELKESEVLNDYSDDELDKDIDDLYDMLKDTLKEAKDYIDVAPIEIAITIKSNKITAITVETDEDQFGESLVIEITFEVTNDVIEIDYDAYDKLYDEYAKLVEEYHSNDYYSDDYYSDDYYYDDYYYDDSYDYYY